MIVLLVPLPFIFTFLFFFNRSEGSLRECFLKSFLVLLLFVAISTEFLSVLNSINYSALVAAWGLALLAAVFVWLWYSLNGPGTLFPARKDIKIKLSGIEWVGVGIIVFILGLTLLIAVLAPPNNFDSMTYHMARVAEWIQHQNVRFYPTNIPRQNHAMPLAEFSILHLQVLSRSDRYANLVQWTSFLVAIIVVSLITQEFGGSQTGQVYSGVLAATLPMAIVQSSSTQNDLVVGALCLGFAYFLLRVTKELKGVDIFFSAVVLGLALLTKGTAYIFCAGMGLGIGWGGLIKESKEGGGLELLGLLSVIVIGGLLVNTGHYFRNIGLYGLPISPANSRIVVDQLSIGNTFANLIRNIAIHLSTPFSGVNKVVSENIRGFLGQFGNHPSSTFGGTEFELQFFINDDFAGNFLHAVLFLLLIPVFTIMKQKDQNMKQYTIGLVFAIVLYSASIKWQPWGSRLHTPLFFFGIPLIGVLSSKNVFSKNLSAIFGVFFVLYSVPFIMINSTRPLIPFFEQDQDIITSRVKKYFSDRPKRYEQFSTVLSPFFKGRSVLHTDRLHLYFLGDSSMYWDYRGVMRTLESLHPEEVGFCVGSNDWEYPFWVLADRHASFGKPRFRHVGIENNTMALIQGEKSPPEYVLATKSSCMKINEQPYKVIFTSDAVKLLQKK